jgi:NAD(P)H-dependent FMN reductase
LDLIYSEWNYKPVAYISYGGISGGIRAVEQLRQVAIELRLIPISESVSIPFIRSAFDDQGHLVNPERIEKTLDSLLVALAKYFN